MSRKVRLIVVLHLLALTLALAARTTRVATQEQPRGMLSLDKSNTSAAAAAAQHNPTIPAECRGPISMVTDVGFEGVKTTGFNFSNNTGGGESGRFDKRPVLSTKVRLEEGTCLNAHFSAIVGSRQTYGVASITMFQVTLTPAGGARNTCTVTTRRRTASTVRPSLSRRNATSTRSGPTSSRRWDSSMVTFPRRRLRSERVVVGWPGGRRRRDRRGFRAQAVLGARLADTFAVEQALHRNALRGLFVMADTFV